VKLIETIRLDGAKRPRRHCLDRVRTLLDVKTGVMAVTVAALLWLTGGASVSAGTISLTNGNSEVTLDPNSPGGVSGWSVDGVNQLFQQWFWYRIGNSGPQYSIDTLGLSSSSQVTSSQASVTYSGTNGLTVQVTYLLMGGAYLSGVSDLGESIAITNTSGSSQDVHFYQYSNFTLDTSTSNPTSAQDVVQFQNSNAVDQSNGGETLAETVITPKPNYRETAFVPVLLNELNNVPAYQLNEVNNNLSDAAKGPGDVSWAYEWDRTIAPGSTFIISKDKSLSGVVQPVPEPSSLVLALAGFVSFAGVARRRLRGR
jgi:hypothetical protein